MNTKELTSALLPMSGGGQQCLTILFWLFKVIYCSLGIGISKISLCMLLL